MAFITDLLYIYKPSITCRLNERLPGAFWKTVIGRFEALESIPAIGHFSTQNSLSTTQQKNLL